MKSKAWPKGYAFFFGDIAVTEVTIPLLKYLDVGLARDYDAIIGRIYRNSFLEDVMKNKGLLSWMLVLVLTLTACGGKDPATSKPAEGSKPAESTTVAENSTAASAAPAESTAPEESAAPVESQESQASVDPAGTIPAQGEKP